MHPEGLHPVSMREVFFAALIAMIVISVATGGKAPAFVGGLSIVIFFGVMDGSDYRIFGDSKERDKNYVTCKIGVACNLAILACFVGIFIRGLL